MKHPTALAVALFSIGCSARPVPTAPAEASTPPKHPSAKTLAGRVERADIETLGGIAAASASPRADATAARALSTVPPGATVRVFFGSWCSDSRREVARFFDALDAAAAPPPFAIEYIAVDRSKSAPGGLTDGAQLKYVPTFVVLRGGKELGRIVESSPNGIERDLAALLRGEQSGVISGRHDL